MRSNSMILSTIVSAAAVLTISSDRASASGPVIRNPQDAARVLEQLRTPVPGGVPLELAADRAEEARRVLTEPGELPRLKVDVEGRKLDLPLEHTGVRMRVVGHVARVEVTQTYSNPFAYPIEAIYVFPLPENAAVDGMRIIIGDRVIEAEVEKRRDAKKTYEEAKRDGHTAALLEQERPNVFTQSVANIAAGTDIDVEIRYLQDLTYDAGEYEVVFPMVVGPRFFPGRPSAGEQRGRGYARDTDEVPDASRVSPPVLGAGVRSGHDISLDVVIEPGLPIAGWDVPTHAVRATATTEDDSLQLTLEAADSIPNRDFVLRFKVAGERPQATLLVDRVDGQKRQYFSLLLHPPEIDVDRLVGYRELIFVVDISGSMSGVPLAMCQEAMERAIGMLRPVDTFNVMTFASGAGRLFERSRPANRANLMEALRFIRGMRAGGGTQMAAGVDAALDPKEADPQRHRYVFFMTDGYVGNEESIIGATRHLVDALERAGQKARVFGYGVGSSTNRHLIEGISDAGKGLSVYATTREDPTLAVEKFFGRIDAPLLTDVRLDWGSARVSEQVPARPPTLFASHPIVIHGQVQGPIPKRVRVHARLAGREVELPIRVSQGDSHELADSTLATLWGRSRIQELNRRAAFDGRSVEAEVTRLGLAHGLVTAHTSLVAVDRSTTVKGRARTIMQPVESPEGVDPVMAGAAIVGTGGLGMIRGSAGRGASGIGSGGRLGGGGVGYGAGVSLGKRRSVAPRIQFSAPVVMGALPPDAIRKVINNHRNQIRHCYERELQKNRSLSGKLVVTFIIAANGAVAKVRVKSTTVNNTAVEQCITRAIARWRFPAPAGGGSVEVNYPFVFRSSAP